MAEYRRSQEEQHDSAYITNVSDKKGPTGMPLAHKDLKKPLLDIVPKGQLIAGYGVGKKLGLKKDQVVKLLGRDFKITKIQPIFKLPNCILSTFMMESKQKVME